MRRGNGGLPYGSGPPKGIALRREGSRRASQAEAAPSNPIDDEDDPDLDPSSSEDPQGQHNLRWAVAQHVRVRMHHVKGMHIMVVTFP